MKRIILILLLCNASFISLESIETRKKPRATIIFVIDQFAYDYTRKLYPYLHHGIKFLLNRGIVYENAYFPHSLPSTSPGHAGLNTGALPKDHGIIANEWCDEDGNAVASDEGDAKEDAVIDPNGGVYDFGKSPKLIMADGITDQFMLDSGDCNPRESYSISLKSRAAIMTANRMGKAVWFDELTGKFTSSKYYFDELPSWLVQFNTDAGIDRLNQVTWKLAYPCKKKPYCFKHINNYTYASRKYSLINKPLSIDWDADNPYELFERTPIANKLILDCAFRCIKTHIDRKSCNEFLIWICLTPLDFVGHDYGPDSLEAIDMIYHLDCQIKKFMDSVNCWLKRTEVLYVLTADHGVCPIPELMHEQGFDLAHRLRYKDIAKELNASLKNDLNVDALVAGCQSAQLFLNENKLKKLSAEKHPEIIKHIKSNLVKQPEIKKVWTYDELDHLFYPLDQIEGYFKNQMFAGRTGKFIVQTYPYCPPQDHLTGTGHRSPYEYDTHVPLIMYQKNNIEKRIIYDKVWALQLANTLAYLLNVPKPSASTFTMLPGIIDYDPITGEVIQTVVI
jgi:predicted AlkP superfamily pyrophosphatase or phosphodiesterase